MRTFEAGTYDVIVIGAGHAGVEAALAAANMGAKTLALTINLDMIAFMPCNPSVGGPAKGIVVREIDALGGAMGKVIDRTHIQMRMLNTGKGPAVRALRAQADKVLYQQEMKRLMEEQANLSVHQAVVEELIVEDNERLLKMSFEALRYMKADYLRKDGLGFDLIASSKMFDALKKLEEHFGVEE